MTKKPTIERSTFQHVKWGVFALALMVFAAACLLHFLPSPHPRGENEQAIWEALVADIAPQHGESIAIVTWSRGRYHGDTAPTHTIRIENEGNSYVVQATAWANEYGWQAKILSIESVH